MSIASYFAVLFLIQFATLRDLRDRHLDTRSQRFVDKFVILLILVHLFTIPVAFFLAYSVYIELGVNAYTEWGYFVIMGLICVINPILLKRRWANKRNVSHTYDVTNSL